jgi:phage-related protein
MTGDAAPQKIPLIFFRSGNGLEPVREWLKELPQTERHAVGKDLLRAQWRWPVGMPLCRPMGGGLWEIRTDLPTKRTARVMLCLYRQHLVALHGFIKKTRVTPEGDLAFSAQTAEGADEMSKKHMGSSIDDFLKVGVRRQAGLSLFGSQLSLRLRSLECMCRTGAMILRRSLGRRTSWTAGCNGFPPVAALVLVVYSWGT